MKIEDIKKAASIVDVLRDLDEARERVRKSGQPMYHLKAPVSGDGIGSVAFSVERAELADFLAECARRRHVVLLALGVEPL